MQALAQQGLASAAPTKRSRSSSSGRNRASRLVTAARPPPRQFRTIREDIDKKRLEKQLGSQGTAAPPKPKGAAAADEEGGPNLAIGAVLAILVPAIGFWLLTKQ